MPFPLADWIVGHPGLPHDLSGSGMKGELRSVLSILRAPRPGDPALLREEIGRALGVAKERVVLTAGATTANSLVLLHLFRRLKAQQGRVPRAGLRRPEYPPLWDTALASGFRVSEGYSHQDVAVLSNPNNPEGALRTEGDLLRELGDTPWVLVDEAFREFSPARSLAGRSLRGWWVTGTFTKVYGADDIRIGYAIPPEGEVDAFRDEADLWVDRPALASVGAALSILRRRDAVLREARGIFQRNLTYLRRRVTGAPDLRAPLWFDRSMARGASQELAEAGLPRGVLVCPGHYFRDTTGVRLCLTRRSFPQDLEPYLELRTRFLRAGRDKPQGLGPPSRPRRSRGGRDRFGSSSTSTP